MVENKDKISTVAIDRQRLSMLDKISLYSCRGKSEIINDIVDSLYENVKKHFPAIEKNGEILSFFPEWHSGFGIDLVKGTFTCGMDEPQEETDKIRDSMISEQFRKIDKLKETRRKLFAAKRTPTQSETPISDTLSTVFSDASTIPEVKIVNE